MVDMDASGRPSKGDFQYALKCRTVVQAKNKQKRWLQISKAIQVSLLQTSHAINKEGTSILYGCNLFEFQSSFALHQLFDAIVRNSVSIAYVKVKGLPNASFSPWSELSKLALLQRPKRLLLPIYALSRDDSADRQAKDIWKVLAPFVQHYDGSSASSDYAPKEKASRADQVRRFNAVEFVRRKAGWESSANDGGMTRQADIEWYAAFKRALLGEFGKSLEDTAK